MRIFLIPLGIALIFGGPYVLWNAESQHRASDFQEASWVENDAEETGHIKIQGVASSSESITCPQKEDETESEECLKVATTIREFVQKEVEECSTTRPQNVLEKLPEQCDSNGENCKPCYLVQKEQWETTNSSSDFAAFTIGNYEVPSDFEAEVLGQKSFTSYFQWEELEERFGFFDERTVSENNAEPGDMSYKYSFIPISEELIVSGTANTNLEIGSGEKTFVISTLSEAETQGKLQAKDTSSKWTMRVISLLMVVFGFMFIFNTIAALPLMLVKIIPFLGKKLEEGISSVVSFIAGLIGLVIWGLMWGTVLVLKNIVALIVIAGVIGLVAVAVVMFAKKHHISLKMKAKEITKADLKK